jgi:hypothetical protein
MSFPGFDWISGKIAQGAYAEAELVLLDFLAQKPKNAHAKVFFDAVLNL